MYPDLSYLFHDLFGTDVDNWTSIFKTFGLLLACAFVGAGWVLRAELKRHEEEGTIKPYKSTVDVNDTTTKGSLFSNALTAFILGMKVPYIVQHFAEFQADPAGVIFSSKGNILIGILAMAAVASYLYMQMQKSTPDLKTIDVYPHQRTGDILILAAVSGVAGAKLFSILENLDLFFQDPWGQIFSGSGLTIYGGLIVAFIVVYRYIKKLGIPPRVMMDIAGMAILVGYAIGRLGCHFSGDGDWGIVASEMPSWWFLPEWLWSYTYPNNVNNDGLALVNCDVETYRMAAGRYVEEKCLNGCGIRYCHELEQAVYTTPVWETILSLISFGFLWMWRRKVKVAGMLFFGYMILNGVERFFIENVRVNPKYNYFGFDLSQAQYISIAFVIVGIIGMIYLWSTRKKASEHA